MTPPTTADLVKTMIRKFDHRGGLMTAVSRIDLIRPGDRRRRYVGQVASDVFLFSDASYRSTCALNSDASKVIDGQGCSFNVHPAGTEVIESGLRHFGECLVVEFTDGLLNDTLSDAAGRRALNHSITNRADARITRLAQDLRQSVVAANRGDYVNTLYVEGLLLAVRAVLAEMSQTRGAPAQRRGRSDRGGGDTRVARAIDYLEAHLGTALSVAELASVAALSDGHFSRAFKTATGESVWTYVQRRRVEHAKGMLEATDLSIAEIAHACGFANQGHLTSCFRRWFGTTPGAARRDGQWGGGP